MSETVENVETSEKTVSKRGAKQVLVTLEDGNVIGRADYCRQLAGEGKSRKEITAILNELRDPANPEDKPIPYQVVFAATKGMYPERVSKKKVTEAKLVEESAKAAEDIPSGGDA